MTREEAIKFLNDTKVYVNGKSEEIQEKLFSLNFKWCDSSQKVKKVNYPFLFLHNGWISYDNNMIFFTECSYREITVEDILNINIGESKSTYHPFKDAKECWCEMLKHQSFSWAKGKEVPLCCISGLCCPDLSSSWHKPSEEPQKYPILCQDELGGTWEQYDLDLNDYPDGWKEFKEVELIVHWAYIEDLLPKNI